MKIFYKSAFVMMCAIGTSLGFVACSDSDNESGLSQQEQELQQINIAYVNNNVIPIYKNLADQTILLQEAVETLQTSKTDANVAKACDLWKVSRQYWEWSEAFLFGAASKYSIDPHIDTWPLDKKSLNDLLNSTLATDMENAIANLNNGLVGYHGMEYIIFREGANRSASLITDIELNYAVAVARDLALSCCRLEAAWAGMENIAARKQAIIEDAEMEPEDNFSEQMKLAGFAGSTWRTVAVATETIIDGCKTIVDEVGTMKIGAPYTGRDINYIESPHAYNSIQDFYDNITGVQYALYGKMGATSPQPLSVFACLEGTNPTAAAALKTALETCLAKIDAMPRPFVENYTDTKVKEAIDACPVLEKALEDAKSILK